MSVANAVIRILAFVLATCSAADATPTVVQSNGGNGAPVSNAIATTFSTTLTSSDVGNIGILSAACTSAMTTPTGWSVLYTDTHVGTANYFAQWTKLLTTSDTSQSIGCSGTKYAYTIKEWAGSCSASIGTLVSATSTAATGSVTYTVPKAGGAIDEYYEAYTASGSAATAITDSASVSTTASANSGNPGASAEILYSFVSATDPYSGVTQPYANAGTWNHSNSVLGSVDVFLAPACTVFNAPAWWPPPFDRIQ